MADFLRNADEGLASALGPSFGSVNRPTVLQWRMEDTSRDSCLTRVMLREQGVMQTNSPSHQPQSNGLAEGCVFAPPVEQVSRHSVPVEMRGFEWMSALSRAMLPLNVFVWMWTCWNLGGEGQRV
eukprot:5696600-Amphidinium_carterae.1